MKKRMYSDESVEKKVMDVYPVTKKEKKCAIERAKMEAKRFELRKRLLDAAGNDIQDEEIGGHTPVR